MPPCAAFLAGGPGPGEWILLFLAVLVLFGPRRLPDIARTLGKVLSELRRASQDFKDEIMRIEEPDKPEPPSSSARSETGTEAVSPGAATPGEGDAHDRAG